MPRRRALPRHLELRASGYHWRRRWPTGIRGPSTAPSGRGFFLFPLRTELLLDAKILAARLTALAERIFAALTETAMPIAPELAEAPLVDLARFEFEASERARAVAPTRSPEAADLDRAREMATEDVLRRALTLHDRDVARGPVRAAAERLGVIFDEGEDH